ncbi:hypothetical protein WICPIJ_000228 [Wickerhamomyces pijperi]|uniref:Uncharacterized protein n=1 Tax=Wickerhamomyces pijperi TaxID=599730 RepID=A0A9P8QHC7_WICPI|nr:hypothetical protein WICPIJ_000228 [Wickerhamomyces pijperi]
MNRMHNNKDKKKERFNQKRKQHRKEFITQPKKIFSKKPASGHLIKGLLVTLESSSGRSSVGTGWLEGLSATTKPTTATTVTTKATTATTVTAKATTVATVSVGVVSWGGEV